MPAPAVLADSAQASAHGGTPFVPVVTQGALATVRLHVLARPGVVVIDYHWGDHQFA